MSFKNLIPNFIPNNEKRRLPSAVITEFKAGRGDMIRTCDPLLPRQVRYQTALRPDLASI
jgi:hypothetical protein